MADGKRRMIIKQSILPNPDYEKDERDVFGNPVESNKYP